MKRKSKSIMKCIMTFVLTLAMVLGAVPLPQITMVVYADSAPTYSGGSGTAEDPYKIATANDLIALSSYSNSGYGEEFSGKYFVQTADITLTGNFTPIRMNFSGTYDGGNHIIYGLTVSGAERAGLFAGIGQYSASGTVKNIVLYKPSVTGNGYAGAIAGSATHKDTKIENCYVISPTITGGGDNQGAIVGSFTNGNQYVVNQIKDCSVYGTELMYNGNNDRYVYNKTTLYKLTLPAGVTAEATSGTLKATVSVAGGTECYCTSGTVFTLTADDSIVSGTGLKQFTTTAGTLDATSTAGQVTLIMSDSADAVVTLEDVSPTITVAEATYAGRALTPDVTVTVNSSNLTADDYTVAYSNNTNAGGSASVSITGKGLYVGTASQTFTIAQKEVGLEWDDSASFTYNGSEQAPTATATGLCGNDICTVTVTGAATDAGEQTATATGLSNNNYKLPAEKTHIFTISPAAATVTADDKSKTYNESNPELTATVTGLVGSDAASVISYSLSRAAGEDVGTYAITPTGETAQDNYTVTYTPGTFTINAAAAPSLVDANKPTANTLTYNGSNQELVTAPTTPLGSGYTLKYSTDSGSTWSETIPTGKNATDYTVKAKYFGDGNHADSAEMSVVVSIAPKPVTVDGITASDKTYDGTTTATLVYTGANFTGIENGDTLTVTATGAFADANAGDSKNVTISGITLGGASKDNYVLAGSGQQTTTTAKIDPVQ